VVAKALARFGAWLRESHDFPMRVPVYLLPGDHVVTLDGVRVSASFFAPFDRNVEPYIRIATGDYAALRAERGRDSALASFIISFAHEIIHYQQWLKTGNTTERGVSRKAVSLLRQYEKTTDRP